VRGFPRNQKLCFAACTYQHMIIAASLTLVAKSCTLHGAFWLPGLADYPLRSGCAKNTLWVVAPCSMNMSQQYFGEINWGFSFSMQFFEAVQLLKPKFLSLQLDYDRELTCNPACRHVYMCKIWLSLCPMHTPWCI